MPQPSVYDFLPTIESQRGDRYVFGAEARFSDPNPPAFDCSELIEWGLARIGVPFVDGASNQFGYCRTHHTVIPVAQGVVTWGALLFRITPPHNHVAVSLGNGQTFEARGAAYGVNTFEALGRKWTAAALIPGLDYSAQHPPVRDVPPAHQEDDMTPEQADRLIKAVEAQGARLANIEGIVARWGRKNGYAEGAITERSEVLKVLDAILDATQESA